MLLEIGTAFDLNTMLVGMWRFSWIQIYSFEWNVKSCSCAFLPVDHITPTTDTLLPISTVYTHEIWQTLVCMFSGIL